MGGAVKGHAQIGSNKPPAELTPPRRRRSVTRTKGAAGPEILHANATSGSENHVGGARRLFFIRSGLFGSSGPPYSRTRQLEAAEPPSLLGLFVSEPPPPLRHPLTLLLPARQTKVTLFLSIIKELVWKLPRG